MKLFVSDIIVKFVCLEECEVLVQIGSITKIPSSVYSYYPCTSSFVTRHRRSHRSSGRSMHKVNLYSNQGMVSSVLCLKCC